MTDTPWQHPDPDAVDRWATDPMLLGHVADSRFGSVLVPIKHAGHDAGLDVALAAVGDRIDLEVTPARRGPVGAATVPPIGGSWQATCVCGAHVTLPAEAELMRRALEVSLARKARPNASGTPQFVRIE